MKKHQRGEAELAASIIIIIFVIVGVGYLIFGNWSCKSRWGQSGMPVSWGPVQGCLVQTPAGRWVPDDRVREIELQPQQQPRAEVPKQ